MWLVGARRVGKRLSNCYMVCRTDTRMNHEGMGGLLHWYVDKP